MNTMITLNNIRRLLAIALFATLASSGAAACLAADAPSTTVKYADLNVRSMQDAATLYARIQAAAKMVCSNFESRDPAYRPNHDACLAQAIGAAVAKVDQPTLFTVYQAKNKSSTSIVLAAAH
jgi:UrcA family protein